MPDPTKVFLDFTYAAIMDVLKTLITLDSGVFIISLTFAEKIVEVHSANKLRKVIVIVIWALLVLSIMLAFFSMQFLFVANANIRLGRDFGPQMERAVTYMEAASFMFVGALIALAATASHSLMQTRRPD